MRKVNWLNVLVWSGMVIISLLLFNVFLRFIFEKMLGNDNSF